MFARVMGVLIFMIGLNYFTNAMTLYGVNTNVLSAFTSSKPATAHMPVARIANGVQEIRMAVESTGYSPEVFTIKQGVPTKWLIDAKNAFGCTTVLVSPKLAVQKTLEKGENTIEFTPKEKGTIPFSCGMGMIRGSIEVI